MKTFKRISALIGAVLLIGLTVVTLVFAILGNYKYMVASIFCMVVIPVIIWAMNFFYNLISGKGNDKKPRNEEPSFPKQATNIDAPLHNNSESDKSI